MKATSTCRIVARRRTSSSKTVPVREAETASATARRASSVRPRSISAAALPATIFEHRFGMAAIACGDRLAIHGHQQPQRLARAVVERKGSEGIHALPREHRIGRKLREKARLHVLTGAPERGGEGQAFQRAGEIGQHLAVQGSRQGAHRAARVVGIHGHENHGRLNAVRQLTHEVREQVRPARSGHRQGDPAQGLHLSLRNSLGAERARDSERVRCSWQQSTARCACRGPEFPAGYMADTWRLQSRIAVANRLPAHAARKPPGYLRCPCLAHARYERFFP